MRQNFGDAIAVFASGRAKRPKIEEKGAIVLSPFSDKPRTFGDLRRSRQQTAHFIPMCTQFAPKVPGIVATLGSFLVGTVISLFGFSTSARADFMAGDASAATLSPDGVRKNPANFAFVSNGYFDLSPRIFEVNSLFVRYPGFATVPKEIRGISPMSALSFAPFSVDPSKNRLGFVLSEVLPPIGIQLEFKKLPLVILDQLMFVDIKTKAQVRFGLGGAVAYRASERLGVGLSASFRSVSLQSSLRTPDDGAEIASIKTEVTQMSVTGGARFVAIPGRLAVGISSILVSMIQLKNSFDGGFTNVAGGAERAGSTPNILFGQSILVGMHLMATPRVSVRTDIQYSMANRSERRFSIVDLEEQPVDSYDTIGLRLGSKVSISAQNSLTGGYVYEPARVGPGERGPGTKTGFGTIDYIPVFVGLDDLRPYHRFVAGLARNFGRMKGFDRWTLAGGLAYQVSSLGIDENGELPGAYRQKKLIFPVQVTYRY